MPALGINVAVISEDRILLTKRDDFEVWCLPSGGVEEGESLAEAAVRETKEETGQMLSSFVWWGYILGLAHFQIHTQSYLQRLR